MFSLIFIQGASKATAFVYFFPWYFKVLEMVQFLLVSFGEEEKEHYKISFRLH